MLLNFRFENFKSFESLSHFSMITGGAKKHPNNYIESEEFNVLKFSAVYGPNSGGKSNFIDALGLSQAIILNDLNMLITKDRHNKNNPENKNKLTKFEYELLIDNKVYSYGFSVHLQQKRIYEEYLLDITDDEKEDEIFIRQLKGKDNIVNVNYKLLNLDQKTINRIEVYKEDIVESALFLNTLNRDKKSIKSFDKNPLIIEKIYNWFLETLEVISPEGTTKSYNLTYLNDEYLKALGKYLNAFDTGVKEVRFEKTTEEALGLPVKAREKLFENLSIQFGERNIKEDDGKHVVGALITTNENIFKIEKNTEDEIEINEIRFVHSAKDVTYSLDEESDGTRRIIDIFSILLGEEHKVYVIDELDRSLHPNLTYNFIKQFLSKSNTSQLIVSTHEDRLLDLNLLRRDQIWFVERGSTNNSELYSLEDFKERFDKDILKQYLEGRYGSVPNFDFVFEE